MYPGWKIIALVLAISASASGFVYWQFHNLPHPSRATQSQIGHWLVLKNLEDQPHEVQLAMVNRLARDADKFADSFQGSTNGEYKLSDRQLQQFLSNADHLQHVWFRDRVGQYVAIPPEGKRAFLKEQIVVVNLLAHLIAEHGELINLSSSDSDGSAQFFDDVQAWVSEHPDENRDAAYTAVQDAVCVWLSVESLEGFPMATRRKLADQIALELDTDPMLEYENHGEQLTPQESDLLAANTELLIEAWIYGQAEHVAQIEEHAAKQSYVDDLLRRVQAWNFTNLLQDQEGKVDTKLSAFGRLTELFIAWIERAPPPHDKQLRSLFTLARQRVFSQMIKDGFFKKQ